jgi:hypothetical protein
LRFFQGVRSFGMRVAPDRSVLHPGAGADFDKAALSGAMCGVGFAAMGFPVLGLMPQKG